MSTAVSCGVLLSLDVMAPREAREERRFLHTFICGTKSSETVRFLSSGEHALKKAGNISVCSHVT